MSENSIHSLEQGLGVPITTLLSVAIPPVTSSTSTVQARFQHIATELPELQKGYPWTPAYRRKIKQLRSEWREIADVSFVRILKISAKN